MENNKIISRKICHREEIKIFEEIGRAIAEWHHVEEILSHIYCYSVNEFVIGGPILTSFKSLSSVQLKLKMIRSSINHTKIIGIPDSYNPARTAIADKWGGKQGIQRIIESHNENRNKLAHGSLIYPYGHCPEESRSLPVWAPFFDIIRYHQARVSIPVEKEDSVYPDVRWSANDIASVRRRFIELQHILTEFAHSFRLEA